MSDLRPPPGWAGKFRCALRGVGRGIVGQSSFRVHLPMAAAVVVAGAAVGLPAVEWAVLAVCITMVIAAELFNSSLEALAPAVDREQNPHLRDALDIAAGAVLAASIGAAAAGLTILGPPIWKQLTG